MMTSFSYYVMKNSAELMKYWPTAQELCPIPKFILFIFMAWKLPTI